MVFTIQTKRLFLRPFQESDLPAYHAQIGSDPDVMRYLPGGQALPQEEFKSWVDHFIEHWQARGYGFLVAELRSTGQLIGDCGLQWLDDLNEVEVGYAFGKAYWGQGYASEAARASLRWGFEDLGLASIVAVTHIDNHPSRQLLQKLGLRYLGQVTAYGGEVTHFRITAEEYQTQYGAKQEA
jgi:ribosomal-protein-alanine N-acetyltransferase